MSLERAPGEVLELTTYPIKGCAGASSSTAMLGRAGLSDDRSFMVVDDNGVFRSQRRDPRLATVRPTVHGGVLTVAADGVEPLDIAVATVGARRDVTLFGAPYTGIDQGDAAAEWFSDVLGKPSRLVRVPPDHARVTTGEVAGTSGYADSCAVHLTSTASLAELNARIVAAGGEPVPMARFRPNIVVTGWGEPHVEDLAGCLEIDGARLRFAKLAIRCVVTTVDQDTGAKLRFEPLRTLATYRRQPDGGLAFGTKYVVEGPGRLAVGSPVRVTGWR